MIIVQGVQRPTLHVPYPIVWGAVYVMDAFNRRVRAKWDSGFDPVRVEMGSHFWYINSKKVIVAHLNANYIKAQEELGFCPRDPLTTLQDTIHWINKNIPPVHPLKASEKAPKRSKL